MKDNIIFTLLLIFSAVGVIGQEVDSNTLRTEKIKSQLSIYLNDDFPNNGVEYIKKETGSLDLKDKITLYDFYLTKLKEYYESRKQKINQLVTLKSLLDKYEGKGGYDYVWNKYKEEADKAWETDKKQWNLTTKVGKLIANKKLEFISQERDVQKNQLITNKDYKKMDRFLGDIELAIQNIKDDISQISKDQNSNEIVIVNNKTNALKSEVAKYRVEWNSYVCNEYLNLTEINLYLYNPDLFTQKSLAKRALSSALNAPISLFITPPNPESKNTFLVPISMIDENMIHKSEVDTQKKYREVYSRIKNSLTTNEFADLQEAQKIYTPLDGSEK